MTVILRPESPGDLPFIESLVRDTIILELQAHVLPEPLRSQLVNQQAALRRSARGIAEARSLILVADGVDAGWMVTTVVEKAVHINEVMVRPELRNQGIGGAAIGEILAVALASGQSVSLSVRSANIGARRLYERLGFEIRGGDEIQLEMSWQPRQTEATR